MQLTEPGPSPFRSWRGSAWLGGAGLIVVAVAGAALYAARATIAERLAGQWLARQGVASSLTVRSLGLTGLSAGLRLGNPADPDLTIERMDVDYAVSGPWNGKPFSVQTRALHLIRPRLRLRLVDGRLDMGALQPLIAQLAKTPSSGGPQPDIVVEDGVLLLSAPDGPVRVKGAGALRGGILSGLDAQIDPFVIGLSGVKLTGHGGALHLTQHGGRMQASADFGADVVAGGQRLNGGRISITGDLPYPTPKGLWAGPARVAVAAQGVSGDAPWGKANGGVLNLDLDGVLRATATAQSFVGKLLATGQFSALARSATRAGQTTARMDLARVTLTHDADGAAASGEGLAHIEARDVTAAGVAMSVLSGDARLRTLGLRMRGQRITASAVIDGGLDGRGGLPEVQALRLARAAPVLSGEAAYVTALAKGLRGFRIAAPRWRATVSDQGAGLSLAAPARLDTDSGARIVLTDTGRGFSVGPRGGQGAADLSLAGGGLPTLSVKVSNGKVSPAGLQGDIAAEGALDALMAREAHFQLKGHLASGGPRLSFTLARCGPVAARGLDLDANAVDRFAATLCPGDQPLIAVSPHGWAAHGKIEAARGDMDGVMTHLRDAAGNFAVTGVASRLDSVAFRLDRAQIIDAADSVRFRPVRATGQIGYAGGVWAGTVSTATRAGQPIGDIRIRHDVATGEGRADIDAKGLAFAANALQPAALTPLANFAREADGPAAFQGWFAWGPGGKSASGGELVAKALKFKSALGPVLGIDADLHFTSLSPLITAPDQILNVGLVQAITPISGLSARFELGPRSISIGAASGAVAQGRFSLEPIVAPLAAGATLKGVLVLDHINIGDILAASTLADTVKLDGVVDGRIPFELGPAGLTIQQGRLTTMRPGRLTISRKALTGGAGAVASPANGVQANFAQDMAYQAMEDLAFDQMDASINSLPRDRLGILFHIKGRHDPPQRRRAVIGLGDLIRGQPLAKPLALPSDTRIDLTLDTSLNFGELVRALGQAWRDSQKDGGEPGSSAPVQASGPSVTVK